MYPYLCIAGEINTKTIFPMPVFSIGITAMSIECSASFQKKDKESV